MDFLLACKHWSWMVFTRIGSGLWIAIWMSIYIVWIGLNYTEFLFTRMRKNIAYLYKRAIFQTFWKPDCCTKSLFSELETPYFGSSFVFSSPLNLRGQILPNLTFWIQKWHITPKSRYHYSKIFVSWDKCMEFWFCLKYAVFGFKMSN